MTQDLLGKTCLITGATSGIGLETARGLVARGARVLIVARSAARGDAVAAELRSIARANAPAIAPAASEPRTPTSSATPSSRATSASSTTHAASGATPLSAAHSSPASSARADGVTTVDLLLADLSRQADVRRLADDVMARTSRLDLLINNAGILTRTRDVTADGLETQFAVNHLAPFLLTNLLVNLLHRSAPSRIVNVASQVESMGRIDFDDLQRERHYDPTGAYAQSKLANVLFTYELARRLTQAGMSGVTVNCLHPGVIATKLVDAFFGRTGPARLLNRLRFGRPSSGAAAVLHVATARELDGVTGRYFHERTPQATSAQSYDEAVARRLWEVSARLTGLESAPLSLAASPAADSGR